MSDDRKPMELQPASTPEALGAVTGYGADVAAWWTDYYVRAHESSLRRAAQWKARGIRRAAATCLRRARMHRRMMSHPLSLHTAEVSDGGPLTHESPAAQSRRSLH